MQLKTMTGLVCVLSVSALLIPAVIPSSCHAAPHKTLQIKGSDTMVNLGQAWAEEFMARHRNISIAITGGGSGTGIASIISGTCDIAQSSRDISDEERQKAGANGLTVREVEVGYDGIAVIVHPSNPVQGLTLEQLADIYTGKITNWNQVGGKNLPLLVLSRERNSGTHIYFLEHVLRRGNPHGPEEFARRALMMPSNQAIVQEVKSSESAIGYVGLGYVEESEEKIVPMAAAAGSPYVMPTVQTIQSKDYPISRPLYFLIPGEPSREVEIFLEFVLSPEGQEIVELLDFIPLNP